MRFRYEQLLALSPILIITLTTAGRKFSSDNYTYLPRQKLSSSLDPVAETSGEEGNMPARCAIVLNSGVLTYHGYEYGGLIDEHDVVVRFNMAPTVGFEKAVGSLTTHMWTFSDHFPEFKDKLNSTEYSETKLIIGPYSWDAKGLKESGIPPSRYIIPNASEIANVCKAKWLTTDFATEFPHKRCSSGVNAFIYFEPRCNKISFFGLYAGDICDIPYYYFSTFRCDPSDPDANDRSHNFTHEHLLFKAHSAGNKRVTFYPGLESNFTSVQ